MNGELEAALSYLGLGWQPVAAPVKGKSPRGAWKRFQHERLTTRDVELNFSRPANVFIVTGAISQLCVLDCDDEASLAWWRDKLGGLLDETTAVRTGKGWHFYFRMTDPHRNQSNDGGDSGKWDIRADGGGVVAPPSIHESGRRYTWERGPECLKEAPPELWQFEDPNPSSDAGARSMLTHLLQNPPMEGARNSWLSRVAGHYAKHIPHEDAFEQMVWDANAKLSQPLPDEEVQKLIVSIWNTERAKAGEAVERPAEDGSDSWRDNLRQPTEENGYLVSGGYRIMAQTRQKQEDGYVYSLASWLDCDVRVLGLIETEHDRQFSVELRFPSGRVAEDVLSSATVSDFRELNKWLARHGASIAPPDTIWPIRITATARMLRYLQSQDAPPMQAAEALGWDENSQAFITHDGIIRAAGAGVFEDVRPDPSVKHWAPYRYGFGDKQEARRILAEVLTFHDETVTSVFGAWWAACFLKPQIQARTSQFPFMALEAASESGKTTGFFSLMMQLGGNHAGHINPTRAALRDYLSANNNGIVWVDDLDSLEDMGELLRQVTVGGSLVKKGQDNTSQAAAQMRSALVVSGESLGLRDQKALSDRAVGLHVPSPVGRQSLHGDYPQWDDIKSLTEAYPDLTEFAGNLVQLALQQTSLTMDIKKLRTGVGRHADTLAIIRVGARILRGMLGTMGIGIVERVDAWVGEQLSDYTGQENALTLKLLPLALVNLGWPERPEPPDAAHRRVATPAFVDENSVLWFSPKLMAEWWAREPRRKIVERTESEESLIKQAQAIGLGGSKGSGRKDFKLVGTQKTMRYWRCPEDLAAKVLERSRGIQRGEEVEDDNGQLVGG